MTLEDQKLYDKIRSKCWDNALSCFGFNYIFNQRINKYSNYNKRLKFYALVFPALIGLIAFGYKTDHPKILDISIAIAIPLTILQFVFSILAITRELDNELGYSNEASQHYNYLSDRFKNLGETPPSDCIELNHKYELLNTEYNGRSQQDSKHTVKEKEKRKGMRCALREFQRECVGCKKTPLSMESTKCDVCGKFSFLNSN